MSPSALSTLLPDNGSSLAACNRCSDDTLPSTMLHNVPLGVSYMAHGLVYLLMYALCLRALCHRSLISQPCYQLMAAMGAVDVLGIAAFKVAQRGDLANILVCSVDGELRTRGRHVGAGHLPNVNDSRLPLGRRGRRLGIDRCEAVGLARAACRWIRAVA